VAGAISQIAYRFDGTLARRSTPAPIFSVSTIVCDLKKLPVLASLRDVHILGTVYVHMVDC